MTDESDRRHRIKVASAGIDRCVNVAVFPVIVRPRAEVLQFFYEKLREVSLLRGGRLFRRVLVGLRVDPDVCKKTIN